MLVLKSLPIAFAIWKISLQKKFFPVVDFSVCSVYKIYMNSRQIIKELKKAGFVLVKVSGDHHKFKHENGKIVIIPHPKKDLPLGTVRNIYKMAGLKWRK